MPQLQNIKHERFAQLVANGRPAGRAYEEAGYDAAGDSADAKASRLVGNGKVSARIEELREKAESKSEFTRDMLVQFYADIIQAKPEDAAEDSPLCELKMSKAGPYYAFPDKLKAADSLSKMLGWNEPEKHEHKIESDPIAELVREIRSGREGTQ